MGYDSKWRIKALREMSCLPFNGKQKNFLGGDTCETHSYMLHVIILPNCYEIKKKNRISVIGVVDMVKEDLKLRHI